MIVYKAREPQRLITSAILGRPRLNVWAGMGMGKTVATLDALDILDLSEPFRPTLVIAPLRVAEGTWPDEVEKWAHLAGRLVSPVLGDPGARMAALRRDAWIYTVNYENVAWLVDRYAKRPWPFGRVIFDESTRLAGFRLQGGTIRAKALGKIESKVHRWINLTGTPAPNGLLGLWGQNYFVDRGQRLGRTFTAYKERWFHIYNEPTITAAGRAFSVPVVKPTDWAQDDIQTLISDVTISLNPKDYFDLLEPVPVVVRVKLPAKARAHYDDMERRMFTELAGFEVEVFNAANKSAKCLQIASGAAYVDDTQQWRPVHDTKLQALDSIITEASGANILAVYQWKPTLFRMQKAFPKGVLINSKATIDAWNAGKIALGFAHPKSIGHGNSMQDGGHHIVYVDQWWDLELRDQILERLGPMRQFQSGYERPVYIYDIVADNTVDEKVLLRHQTKRSVQNLLTEMMKERGINAQRNRR